MSSIGVNAHNFTDSAVVPNMNVIGSKLKLLVCEILWSSKRMGLLPVTIVTGRSCLPVPAITNIPFLLTCIEHLLSCFFQFSGNALYFPDSRSSISYSQLSTVQSKSFFRSRHSASMTRREASSTLWLYRATPPTPMLSLFLGRMTYVCVTAYPAVLAQAPAELYGMERR